MLTTVLSSEGQALPEDQCHQLSLEALERLRTTEATPFAPTSHPGAQWFPDAGFGLFVHWGIHSVAGIEPSWAMMKNCAFQQDYYGLLGWDKYLGREGYYTLLGDFDPDEYDPDQWLEAAAAAGMKYAVMTTKHHDGYALWPSAYGELSTKQHLGGRDLMRPFVEACRKHGLKVGFYFSQRDWGYPGFPQSLDAAEPYEFPADYTPEQNQEAFDQFYAYTVGQLSEILTRYGRIDLLWFDGMAWQGIEDMRTDRTLAWIRSLQPHIVLNDRWGDVGDFATAEGYLPEEPPDGWWEHCVSWSGHWGYSPHVPFQPNLWVMTKLVRARAGGGSFLLSVGPAGDGSMRPEYYQGLRHLSAWMDTAGESLIDVEPVRNWPSFSNVPITQRDGVWYLHLLPTQEGSIELDDVPAPREIRAVNYDVVTTYYTYDRDTRRLTVHPSMTMRDDLDTVFAVHWETEP